MCCFIKVLMLFTCVGVNVLSSPSKYETPVVLPDPSFVNFFFILVKFIEPVTTLSLGLLKLESGRVFSLFSNGIFASVTLPIPFVRYATPISAYPPSP